MTNDATRANATALPEMNRRRMLLGTAIIPACGMAAVVPAIAMPGSEHSSPIVSADIETAFNAVTDARRELVAAKDARDWLADEWRHLWPRAPQSMQWHSQYSGTAETDVVGRSYRDGNGKTIQIKTRKEVDERRSWLGGQKLRVNASVRAKERHEKWCRDSLAEVMEIEAYLDETERLREVSGSHAVLARINTAEDELERSISALMELPAGTLADLHIKAQAALIAGDVFNMNADRLKAFPVWGTAFSVVLDVIALAQGGAA